MARTFFVRAPFIGPMSFCDTSLDDIGRVGLGFLDLEDLLGGFVLLLGNQTLGVGTDFEL